MCVCVRAHIYVQLLMEARLLEARVIGICELPDIGSWDLTLVFMMEQQSLLTTDPSLQLWEGSFEAMHSHNLRA